MFLNIFENSIINIFKWKKRKTRVISFLYKMRGSNSKMRNCDTLSAFECNICDFILWKLECVLMAAVNEQSSPWTSCSLGSPQAAALPQVAARVECDIF